MANTKEKLARMLEQTIAQVGGFGVPRSDARRMAADLIQQGVTIPEWISVEDRLPDKHGEPYVCLLKFPEGGQFPYVLNWYEYGDNGYVNGRHFQDDGVCGLKVTHWMPLPTPPKGE